MESTKTELSLLVEAAVTKALGANPGAALTDITCPGCGQDMHGVPAYLDHRVKEYMDEALGELKTQVGEIKIPTSAEFLAECKDGLCGIIEEVYDVTKKGAEPPPPEAVIIIEEDTPTGLLASDLPETPEPEA